jgi:hypothetical protein
MQCKAANNGQRENPAANNGKPPCISTSSLNWSQKAQLTAAQFYANLTGWTFGFGAGLDAGAGVGPKGSKWNFGVGGSGSTLIVADASGNAGFLNSVSGGFSAVKMGSTGRWGAGAAAITFGVFTPVPLAISLLLGPIVGGYTGIFLRTESRWVAFSGAVMGIVVMIALVTFMTSLLAVWITRRIGGVHQTQ